LLCGYTILVQIQMYARRFDSNENSVRIKLDKSIESSKRSAKLVCFLNGSKPFTLT